LPVEGSLQSSVFGETSLFIYIQSEIRECVCRCQWRNWYSPRTCWLGHFFVKWMTTMIRILRDFKPILIRWAYARGKNYRVKNWPRLICRVDLYASIYGTWLEVLILVGACVYRLPSYICLPSKFSPVIIDLVAYTGTPVLSISYKQFNNVGI